MLLHSFKIGVSVIAVAALAYAFYPGGTTSKASSTAKPATQHAKSRHAKAPGRTRKSSKQLAREEPIKPDHTLRGAESQTRSGPPSKMLGGL